MIGKARIHLSRKDLDLIERNLNRGRQPRDYFPERHRRREARRGAGVAFVGLVCLAVAIVAGLAWLLSEIPNFGLGG